MSRAVDSLRAGITAMPPIRQEPPIHTWERNCYELRKHVVREDPDEFIVWPTIQQTMYVGDQPRVREELNDLLKDNGSLRWPNAILRSPIGNPPELSGTPFDSNFVHQAFHLFQWEKYTGKRVENLKEIVEFGGGYGAMCLITRRLGFQGDYHIYDLPEFSLLQKFYLEQHKVKAFYNYIEDMRFAVPPYKPDLLLACYSLSEAPAPLRSAFFDTTEPQSCLIAHQDVFHGVQMARYFGDFMASRPEYRWMVISNPYMQDHMYLVGELL